jgi:hypothetical protein
MSSGHGSGAGAGATACGRGVDTVGGAALPADRTACCGEDGGGRTAAGPAACGAGLDGVAAAWPGRARAVSAASTGGCRGATCGPDARPLPDHRVGASSSRNVPIASASKWLAVATILSVVDEGLLVGVGAVAPVVLAKPVPESFDRIEFR